MSAPVPPSRSPVALSTWILGAIVVVLAALLAWTWLARPPVPPAAPPPGPEGPPPAPETPPGPGAAATPALPPLPGREAARWEALAVSLPGWPPRRVDEATCEEVRRDLDDALGGVGLGGGGGDVVAAVDGLLGALAGEEPVTGGELRDCDALVGNVFVLARALGRERLVTLARLARETRADPEVAALALWRYVAVAPSCGERSRGLTRERLYGYGVWVLDTLGGSAFLARRPPREEALVAFYALLAVDRAARGGHNPAGYDLAAGARRVRAMLEGVELRWRDRYLRVLDEVEAAAP